jgi:hypothetical protein
MFGKTISSIEKTRARLRDGAPLKRRFSADQARWERNAEERHVLDAERRQN